MRLRSVLVVLVFSQLQTALVLCRHVKRKDEPKEHKEVRSIVSAIVDAILDGDRKRRAEVTVYSDEDELTPSEIRVTNENHKKDYAKNGTPKHDLKEVTFTKREGNDDKGLRLANAIATSDFNSTADQSESIKGDVMKYEANVTDMQSQGNDSDMDDSVESGSGAELLNEKKFSSSGSGFTRDKSEMYSHDGFELELGSGSHDSISRGVIDDQLSSSGRGFGSGSSYDPESEHGSGVNSGLESDHDDDPEMKAEVVEDSSSGSGLYTQTDVNTSSGSDEEDSMETRLNTEVAEKKSNDNTSMTEKYPDNSTEKVINRNFDEKIVSQKDNAHFTSQIKNFDKSKEVETAELNKSQTFLNTSNNTYEKNVSQSITLGELNQLENTDASNHSISRNSSEDKKQFVSKEKHSGNTKNGNFDTADNPVDVDSSVDNAMKFNLHDNIVGNSVPVINTEVTRDRMFPNPYVNPLENNDKEFEADEEHLGKNIEDENTDTTNGQAISHLSDISDQQLEADANILGQNKQAENTDLSSDQVSRNSHEKSNNQVDLYGQNPEKNTFYEDIDMTLDENSENSPDYDKQLFDENENPGKNTKTENENMENYQWNFEKGPAKVTESSESTKHNPAVSSFTSDQNDATAVAQPNLGNVGKENKGRGDYRYWMSNGRENANNYYSNFGNSKTYGYEDSLARENSRGELAKRNSIPNVVEYFEESPIVSEFVQNNFDRMPAKRSEAYGANPGLDITSHDERSQRFDEDRDVSQNAILGNDDNMWQKRGAHPGNPDFPPPIKEDVLDSLVNDVGEPWVKDFLTKTLEMAVNGDKTLQTSTRDGDPNLDTSILHEPLGLNSANTNLPEHVSDTENSEMARKDTLKPDKDEMPADATKTNDKDEDKSIGDDDDSMDSLDDDEQIVVKTRYEPFEPRNSKKKKPSGAEEEHSLPDLIKKDSAKNQTQSPQQAEVTLSETLKHINQTPVPILMPAQAPVLQLIPPTLQIPKIRIAAAPQVPGAPVVKNIPRPANQISANATNIPNGEKNAPLFSGEDSKGLDKHPEGILTTLNNIMDGGIDSAGETSPEDDMNNKSRENQLLHVLKDAIPVNSRRPNGTDSDLKQEIEDLKDYASALTDTAHLSSTHHDDLARKLAKDLLDEMKVADERKAELLKELMAFVTAMEVATVRERLAEIRAQVLSFALEQSSDPTKMRGEAVRLLDEFFEQLPLPKDQIQEEEKRLLDSKFLKKLVAEGERKVLRGKLKKALADLVADKLL